MGKEKTTVIFDTNSYRQIVLNKNHKEITELLNSIKTAEKENNIEPISALTVNLELSSNLVEGKNGINYENCLNGLTFLTNHCFDKEKKMIRIASMPFFKISSMMFGALPIDFEKQDKKFSKVFEKFKSFDKKPNMSKDFYEFVKTILTKHEQGFANTILGLIEAAKYGMEQIHPKVDNKTRKRKLIQYFESDSYAHNLSIKSLRLVAEELEIQLDDQELQNRAYFLREKLPISSAFFQWIFCEIIRKNIDMNSKKSRKKRWNWLWDYQISFLVSQDTKEQKTILVTSDGDMIKILKENGLENNVLQVDQYLEFLKINGSC
ncbi:hypothetical protein [Aquimarina sp. 2201CG14-23]|uniref:hypothetical protein n=1 Tax=Aquimarina mycalae TaxID=3040073 RepID=UPI0024782824|nr:hypothetical protein [Aquimarina sp. 2201CG14-23]MDH7448467.1 hypothetical protein [Aquimarina sp. 2201CG14-23]